MKATETIVDPVTGGIAREGFLIGDGGGGCIEGWGGLE